MALKITRRQMLGCGLAGAAGGLGLTALGTVGTDQLQLEEKELRIKGWEADGMRIAVLGDFHMVDAWDRDRALRAFAMAHAAKPDLLLLVGDFISRRSTVEVDYVKQFAGEIHGTATYPVFSVLGNHDYGQGPTVAHHVAKALEQNGVKLLVNQVADSQGVVIVGYGDALFRHFKPDHANAPMGARSVIAMLHEPDFVDNVPPEVGLVVSGHSHGGQICLPGGTGLYLPRGAHRYTSGFYEDSKRPLYVTRGIGTTGPTLRLFCPPEVTMLTVKSA